MLPVTPPPGTGRNPARPGSLVSFEMSPDCETYGLLNHLKFHGLKTRIKSDNVQSECAAHAQGKAVPDGTVSTIRKRSTFM